MGMSTIDKTPPTPKRSNSFSAIEIVQNLKALSQAGLMPSPLLINCTNSHQFRSVPHEDVLPNYDPSTQTIELSQSFFDTIKMLYEIGLLFVGSNADLAFELELDERGVGERIVETKVLLIASGVEKTEEKAKLLNVKALYTTARLGFMSQEEDEKIRQMQGDGMIASGVFRDWEEVRCYKVILDIMSMKEDEGDEEMSCGI
ncbi:hypothetical protein NMY22_g17109 [Coprinellus aureogranulatus]|nr:hypothetical protein NMY22_g17109 [Coprinellus aureogranulatus]